MSYVRIYEINASAGLEGAMMEALTALLSVIAAVDGCDRAEIVVDEKAGSRFRFIERWADKSDWERSASALPKNVFAPVMAVASQPPKTFAGQAR